MSVGFVLLNVLQRLYMNILILGTVPEFKSDYYSLITEIYYIQDLPDVG